jgi:hypothetical protein
MISKTIVWVATGVICCLTLVLLVPTLVKVGYGTMKIFAGATRAHWRGRRQLHRARRRYEHKYR